MLCNCKNGVSSWELHRTLGVTQKTAWFMLHRLREAMGDTAPEKMGAPGSEVETKPTRLESPGQRVVFISVNDSQGDASSHELQSRFIGKAIRA
jgi:hypothetical protein